MNQISCKDFFKFIRRPAMYVGNESREAVVGFVTGYELASDHSFDLVGLIIQSLENKYSIKASSDGWPGQIHRFAEKNDLSWLTGFELITLEIIISQTQVDEDIQQELTSMLTGLLEYLNNVNNIWFAYPAWLYKWNFIYSVFKQNSKNLNKNMQKALDDINEELSTITPMSKAANPKPSDRAYELVVNFRKLIDHNT
jgi:hypothetical protein